MSLIEYLSAGAVYAICLLMPYLMFRVFYNNYYHDLRKFPGPLLATITDGYAGYHGLRRALPEATWKDHQVYGSVMRYGPNRLVFDTATALRDIYKNPRFTKSRVYLFSLAGPSPFIFNALDQDVHMRKRKMISPALSERSLRDFEPTMLESIDLFLKLIAASGSEPVNLTDRCRRLSMDVAVQLGFGCSLNLQTNHDHDFIFQGISIANYRINSYMNFPALSNLQLDLILKNTPMRAKWHNTVAKMVQARLSVGRDAKRDFYSFVMGNLEVDSDDIKHSELFAESLFFLSAAGDTISTSLAAMFFYLSRNPDCYQKLCNEVRSAFDSSTDIVGGVRLASCRYLRACINEALRMSPPIGGTLWRQVADEADSTPLIIDGHVIPAGTTVGVNIYSIHHNKRYFPDPFKYKPERWLSETFTDDQDDVGASEMAKAFSPFSIGVRSCAGKAMAYLEMSLLVAKTLYCFDFAEVPGPLGQVGTWKDKKFRASEFQTFDALTSRHDGPYLQFTSRDTFA
ncbi:cytochrome P450 [Stachybotrys elegans]|uniref:Cytochrome P450 n=1 Tax=Stachybotrys elegans TaxID=80388 RepID=A0A8K0SHZ7_9HYPO|nr:cytochrome P450 [Stachybotrys elegans]